MPEKPVNHAARHLPDLFRDRRPSAISNILVVLRVQLPGNYRGYLGFPRFVSRPLLPTNGPPRFPRCSLFADRSPLPYFIVRAFDVSSGLGSARARSRVVGNLGTCLDPFHAGKALIVISVASSPEIADEKCTESIV